MLILCMIMTKICTTRKFPLFQYLLDGLLIIRVDEKRKIANARMQRAKEKAGQKIDDLKDDQEFHEFQRDADDVKNFILFNAINLLSTEGDV